jgi:hypothetical protein
MRLDIVHRPFKVANVRTDPAPGVVILSFTRAGPVTAVKA